MSDGRRVGLLYPTPDSGEDDFLDLAGRLRPPLDVDVVYIPWPDDVDDLAALTLEQVADALRRLGSAAHLERVLPDALAGRQVDVLAFAVTSASFLDGAAGVTEQLRTIRRVTGLPATSTTDAYQRAIRHLSLRTVALASVYDPELSNHFVERVRESGAEIVRRVDASAGSDRALAAWPAERIVDLVRRSAHPDAQAVLLPETALHAAGLTEELERVAGCPVLTATQVTLWAAARLLDVPATSPAAGPLFAAES
ncbi:maleate cis-trans isomerase family protein [Nocardia blacklockiae]|uniref:maleate cis-trans isomerase family protein n=1 Tax=Nocardia blacklockiae TaxID=480036 RepID=UPI001894CF38|nr:decarboxylase [Nocardia blacklockiae]MBF6172195.1 decarboxylase [Nocardia blacklockiae]